MTSLKTLETPSALQSAVKPGRRLAAIDILRALTMVLMIFVNDLWSLEAIPAWLGHVTYEEDGMGLADTIFPAFLFIVGMSLPFAINSRRHKGDTDWQLVIHVLVRAAALVIMGVFLVNGENINEAATGMPRLLWNTLCCVSFILIWNAYPVTVKSWVSYGAKTLGILMLLTLAVLYRGGGGEGEEINYFSTYWWGILGLIGWAYLACALIMVFAKNRFLPIVVAWLVFVALSMLASAKMLPELFSIIPSPISHGTLAGLTMGGVLTSMLFLHYKKQEANKKMTLVLLLIAGILIALGMYTRTFWGISKLRETPAWLFYCSAFTILAFVIIYWMADLKGKANWFNFIKPAGTNTLLCYLIPYFAYAFMRFAGIHLPDFLLIGVVGLIKSMLFALLCVLITGGLSRVGIRLKL